MIPKVSVFQRKDNNKWCIRYPQDGKYKRETIGTSKKEAEIAANAIRKEFFNGKFQISERKIISVENLFNEFIIRKHDIEESSKKRYSNFYQSFKRFIEPSFPETSIDISRMSRQHIEEFIEYLYKKENKALKTINETIGFINSMFLYAVEEEYLEKSPCKGVKKFSDKHQKETPYFTVEELKMIWATVDPHWLNFLKFIYYTGLRKGELINLTWDKVSLNSEPKTITIISTDEHKTKTGDKRVIPLSQKALKIIEDQVGKNKKYVFTNPDGSKVEKNRPYNAIKAAGGKNGIKASVHKLRHSFASHLAMKNVSILKIKELLGHIKYDTTNRYSHLSTSSLQDTVDQLDDFE